MNIKRISCFLMAAMLMIAPAILPVCATEAPVEEAPTASDTTAAPVTPDTTAAPVAPVTTAAPVTAAPTTPDTTIAPADADANTPPTGTDTTAADGTGTGEVTAPGDTTAPDVTTPEVTTQAPGTPVTPPAPVEPILVDATANFKHDVNSKYVAVLFEKNEQGQWEMVASEDVTDKDAKQPSIALFNPKNGSLHATFTLEMDEDGEWNITDEDYYNTKLHYLPIIIITFFITLALSVIINILLIKLHKR